MPEDMSLNDMVNFFGEHTDVKVACIGFGPKPMLGYKGCEGRYYLDALPITEDEALRIWREGSAKMMPMADKRLHKLALEKRRACNG